MNKNYTKETILNSNKLREQIWTIASNKRFDMKCSISWCENQITVFNFKLQNKIMNDYSVDNLIPVCNRCHEYINKHGYKKWNTNIEKKPQSKEAPKLQSKEPKVREVQIQTDSLDKITIKPSILIPKQESSFQIESHYRVPHDFPYQEKNYQVPVKVKKVDNNFVPKMPIIPNYIESKNYNSKKSGIFDRLIKKIF